MTAIVSGDAGCDDSNLGEDRDRLRRRRARPGRRPSGVYVYIFRNRATYERLRTAVDACARSYVTDPQTYESVETSPFVIAGQGPWGPQFKDNLRAAIVEAAGTGD